MELVDLAEQQHGVFALDQLEQCDVSHRQLERMISAGMVERVLPSTYRVRGTPPTWLQRVMAGTLSMPGALASHRAAAALHGLRDFDHAPIELVVTRWHRRVRRPSGLIVHESTDLRGVDIGSRRGIPTTTLVRTLVDLPAVVPAHRAGDALDHAIRRDAAILPRVHQRHLEVARRGRRGTAALRELLVERGQGTARVDSGFERRALQLLERHSLPAPQTQHQVRADDFVCYLDIAWPYALVALECDSYEFHSDRRSFAWDRKRRRILLSLGWTVLEATYSEVVGEDPQLLAQLKHLLLP